MNKLEELNPDAYSRFQICCDILKRQYGNKKFELLDVGGASSYFYDFLIHNNLNFSMTVVDIVEYDGKPKEVEFLLGSAEKIPLDDKSFDVVTGIDMLEHLPGDTLKKSVAGEAFRLSRDLVIFAGPTESVAVSDFEDKLNEINLLYFGTEQKWLSEHFKYGKPDTGKVVDILGKSGVQINVFSALELTEWYISSVVNLLSSISDQVNSSTIKQMNRDFNLARNYICDDPQSGYRTFIIASKKGLRWQTPDLSDAHVSRNTVQAYSDVAFRLINDQKNYTALKNEVDWSRKELKKYKKIHKDLTQRIEALNVELQDLRTKVFHLGGGRLVHKARKVENRLKKRSG